MPFVLILIATTLFLSASTLYAAEARVAVPVADLRGEPSEPLSTLEQDPLEESQLLYADPVEIVEEKGGWVRVAVLEQREWSHKKKWEGYPGWMKKELLVPSLSDWRPNLIVKVKTALIRETPALEAPAIFALSLGTRLMGLDQVVRKGNGDIVWWRLKLVDGTIGWIQDAEVVSLEELARLHQNRAALRARLVETARLFLGGPYYWGGRSTHHSPSQGPPHWAIDCSGLVGLVYQANGLRIPRDAHEIWMQATTISREDLAPGDLVFLSEPQEPRQISHVMLYAGAGNVIEGPGTGKKVREISLAERLQEAGERKVIFATALSY